MKTKAIGKILIILLVLILIIGGVFAYLYFGTDLLKTNEQLFFKYVGQLVETEGGFIDTQLSEYNNKKMTGKYENSGEFSVDIDMEGMDENILATVNDFNITYSGQVDNANRKNEQEISINYSDDVNFPFNYKYANGTLGLQTEYISDKYIGIENNNLKEFAGKLGITDTEVIPDTIDLFENTNATQMITFTDEEKEQLKNTYQAVLEDNLEGKEFTKTEENSTTNYSVELTNQELTNVISVFLQTLQNDQILLPKIEGIFQQYLNIMNQASTEEVTLQSMIQDIIDQLNAEKIEEGTAIITISQTNRMLTGITLTAGETEIRLTKTDNQNTLTYGIELNMQEAETQNTIRMYANANYQGLDQLSSVNESYQIGINVSQNGGEQQVIYNFNCTDTFNDSINIANFGQDEIEILNEYESEQLATLLTAIVERIEEVNNMQMEEIGFSEYGNPMIYVFPLTSIGLVTYNQSSNIMEENSISEAANQQFNQMFLQYEGTQSGVNIRSLLQMVVNNNISQTDENRKVEVTGDVTLTKDETEVPRDSIDSASTYNVQLEYDSEGLITQIIITQE